MLKRRVILKESKNNSNSNLWRFIKCDQEVSEVGKGNVDDLSKLSYLDEEKLIEELCIRYKNGQIYVRNRIFFRLIT